MTFALYTYLDVYSNRLVDRIAGNSNLSAELETYLKGRKLDDEPLTLSGIKRSSIISRFYHISNGLGLDNILLQVIEKCKLETYRLAFESFLKIRNRVAHSNPRLDEEKYTHMDFEHDLEKIENVIGNVENKIESKLVIKLVSMFGETISGLSKYFGLAVAIAKVAMIYPSLLDCIVGIRLK